MLNSLPDRALGHQTTRAEIHSTQLQLLLRDAHLSFDNICA